MQVCAWGAAVTPSLNREGSTEVPCWLGKEHLTLTSSETGAPTLPAEGLPLTIQGPPAYQALCQGLAL